MNVRSWRSLHCLIATSVLMATWSPARATVVIESYNIERPFDADAILAPVHAALHARGFLARPEQILAEIRASLPLPVNDNFELSTAEIMQRIDLGMSKARYGKHDEAIHLLEGVLEDLRNNPAVAISLTEGHKWITKALAGLTRAHYEKGNLTAATEVIAELVRSFPDLPIDRGAYGPKLAAFYAKTRQALETQPPGRMLLIVDWADATIFVNEYERGAGGVVDMMYPPGEYRIMVRINGRARRYRIRIEPNGETVFHIHWYTDASFTVSREWLGFVWRVQFPEDLPVFVTRIAKQHPGHGVVVLGIVRRGGHRYIIARKFASATGEYAGGALIELGIRDDAKIRALVSFIADDLPSDELLPFVEEPAPRAPAPASPTRWPMWLATAAAAGGFAAGGYLLTIDGRCRALECADPQRTASWGWGWGAVGLGVTSAALGVYWYLRHRSSSGSRAPKIGVLPRTSGGLVTLGGRF